ncbi:hypothetical protein P691DRAFT_767651 [Macrolepiota fuliginosa MF-IS2]|uniref:DUF659 domain-containing protein n=1 Tax=Macrolepiota fuliginosa MF-IS2 TaxID=1400762 RepID=A0A9P5WXY4_9AGAR|nr:hypothetical protein P691DRAFT_767651 [Macrolepiota fuliginosa MF-IS2]
MTFFTTTTERKTAENLFREMCTTIEKVEKKWNAKVIAFTTDASGESQKAQQLLKEKYPFMVTPDCYAHQINLIVGDYFKTKQIEFFDAASKANDLIAWLQSKTVVLGLI